MKKPRIYARYVLPLLIDLAMRNKAARLERARFIPLARGVTLEIGVGSGLNLPYYSLEVEKLYALDPSAELLRKAARLGNGSRFQIVPLCHAAESIPLADASIDSVVMTWTLCSIADPIAALREIRRVLRTNGELIFIEHGRAPEPAVARWQDRLTPVWKRFTGGCHLNRSIETLLIQGGFDATGIEKSYVARPRIGAYFYRGAARPVTTPSPSGPAVHATGGWNGK
jgi:ubiquinone/menaquinone biosynthesis C-methylase UbiE